MYFCGRFSISEAVLSIAVGDILFSTGSIFVHITEFWIIYTGFGRESIVTTPDHAGLINSPQISQNATISAIPENLILPPMPEDVKKNASNILCWIYIGLHTINILLAIVLWQAVIKENIIKCISYLVTVPFLIFMGYSIFLYHLLMLGLSPTNSYILVMYPLFWAWKTGSLFFIGKFLQEIRSSGQKRKRREEYYQLGGIGGASSSNSLISDRSGSSMPWDMQRQQDQHQNEPYQRDDNLAKIPLLPRKFDISSESLKLDHQTLLGFDDNHSIIRGILGGGDSGDFKEVAIKTLKVTSPTVPHSGRLLKEAHLLAYIGEHESILKFLGVCCKANEKLFLITEYYPKGRLDSFLKDCVTTYHAQTFKSLLDLDTDAICVSSIRKRNEFPNFDTLDILEWAYQIASGMEYLHQKRVIHGVLQAKCIILMDSDSVKIWDFSFARKLKSCNYTVKREQLPDRFPFRWTALECLTPEGTEPLRFSSRTDVWSYGVLLWEMWSLGQVPYGAWSSDIVRGLMSGIRLQRPEHSSQQIYEILKACWRLEPLERPNFALLKLFFQQLLCSLKNAASKLSIQ